MDNTKSKKKKSVSDTNADEFIKNISYKDAIKIADKEGYVHCIGFGKIHINNWTKPKMYSKKEVEDLLLKATSRTWNTRQDVRDWFNKNN